MELPHLQSLSTDGKLYINDDMCTIEAMIPPGNYKSAHAPALLEMPSGDILCAWFAGSFEGSADVSIVYARLKKDTTSWEAPVKVSVDPHRSEQNPSLFLGPDGLIWAMYTAQLDRVPGKDNMQFTSQVRLQKSSDGGQSWSEFETIFPKEGTFCRQPIQVLKNGRFIFGNWLCTDSQNGLEGDPSVFKISDDQGKTWREVEMPESSGVVHPNVVELEENHLIAFMRSRAADFIYKSESFDNGDHWSIPEPTVLPNNNSSISALKLKSGRIAIAYNPTHAPNAQKGNVAWPGLRCPVAVALSEDGGNTFPMIRLMERGEGFCGKENTTNNKQYEYPYLMQSKDGRLHLAFAYKNRIGIKYMSFTEEDITGIKRETVGLYNPTAAQSR